MLSVLKNTPLEKLYKEKNFHILTKEEYIDIVVNQLELLREEIIVSTTPLVFSNGFVANRAKRVDNF